MTFKIGDNAHHELSTREGKIVYINDLYVAIEFPDKQVEGFPVKNVRPGKKKFQFVVKQEVYAETYQEARASVRGEISEPYEPFYVSGRKIGSIYRVLD